MKTNQSWTPYLRQQWAGLHVGGLAGGSGLLLGGAEVRRLTGLTVVAHVLLLRTVLGAHLRKTSKTSQISGGAVVKLHTYFHDNS